MTLPADHAALLRRKDFPVPEGGLAPDERDLLARYGHWMQALAEGRIAPTTPDQEQFIRAARGDAEPRSPFEAVWVKRQALLRPPETADPIGLADRFQRLQAARAAAAYARAEREARRAVLLAPLKPALDALEGEYAARIEEIDAEAARLEAEAREAVLAHGASFRHAGINATFSRGRVTWDGKGLAEYMEQNPEVGVYRRVGKPVVALRFLDGDEA